VPLSRHPQAPPLSSWHRLQATDTSIVSRTPHSRRTAKQNAGQNPHLRSRSACFASAPHISWVPRLATGTRGVLVAGASWCGRTFFVSLRLNIVCLGGFQEIQPESGATKFETLLKFDTYNLCNHLNTTHVHSTYFISYQTPLVLCLSIPLEVPSAVGPAPVTSAHLCPCSFSSHFNMVTASSRCN